MKRATALRSVAAAECRRLFKSPALTDYRKRWRELAEHGSSLAARKEAQA